MLLQDGTTGASSVVWLVLAFAWLALILVAGWKLYVKAGQAGWVSIIPILNVLGLLKIIHRPLWWIVLFLIPIVNIVAWIIAMNDLSKAFGRGLGTTLLLVFLTPIGYLLLGFGSDRYELTPDPLFG